MLDDAIAVTKADRGLLLEAGPGGKLKARLARNKKRRNSATRLHHAQSSGAGPGTEGGDRGCERRPGAGGGREKENWHKRAHVHPHSFIAAPLYALPSEDASASETPQHGELLGAIYLDSTHPAAFSELVRHIFDALAVEAASILENARHMERSVSAGFWSTRWIGPRHSAGAAATRLPRVSPSHRFRHQSSLH